MAMAAHWNVADDHLTTTWQQIGDMAGYHPEWITQISPQEGRTHTVAIDMSTRSSFGEANWYGHKPCNHRIPSGG
jgi:hypothetical protein